MKHLLSKGVAHCMGGRLGHSAFTLGEDEVSEKHCLLAPLVGLHVNYIAQSRTCNLHLPCNKPLESTISRIVLLEKIVFVR